MIIKYLVADTFGTHIGKYNQRLKITKGKETKPEIYHELRLCAGEILDWTAQLDQLVGIQ